MMYLFANDSVLNYYPKFKFEEVKEYQYLGRIQCDNDKPAAKKVDMDQKDNQLIFANKVYKAKAIADLSMRDNTVFHIMIKGEKSALKDLERLRFSDD